MLRYVSLLGKPKGLCYVVLFVQLLHNTEHF